MQEVANGSFLNLSKEERETKQEVGDNREMVRAASRISGARRTGYRVEEDSSRSTVC